MKLQTIKDRLFKEQEKENAEVELKNIFKKDNRIFVVQHSVSQSGLTRRVTAYSIGQEDYPIFLNHKIATVTGLKQDKNGYLVLNGAGMDMHFHLVYSLSSRLYGYEDQGGYKLKHISL